MQRKREVADRVRAEGRGDPPNGDGSQLLTTEQVASRVFPKAEGKGFEPSTPCGAPHFECGC